MQGPDLLSHVSPFQRYLCFPSPSVSSVLLDLKLSRERAGPRPFSSHRSCRGPGRGGTNASGRVHRCWGEDRAPGPSCRLESVRALSQLAGKMKASGSRNWRVTTSSRTEHPWASTPTSEGTRPTVRGPRRAARRGGDGGSLELVVRHGPLGDARPRPGTTAPRWHRAPPVPWPLPSRARAGSPRAWRRGPAPRRRHACLPRGPAPRARPARWSGRLEAGESGRSRAAPERAGARDPALPAWPRVPPRGVFRPPYTWASRPGISASFPVLALRCQYAHISAAGPRTTPPDRLPADGLTQV